MLGLALLTSFLLLLFLLLFFLSALFRFGAPVPLGLACRDTEREREIDGSDVTIVALKLAMNSHFPLPKIRTIGDELTLSLANYRKRGSASYIVREVLLVRERDTEREREIDGSDVTIVALKLAMNSHFPLPKIRTIGDELTLSLAKNSHFSFLPSHFPSLPSRRGHHGGAEIRNEFTLSIAKNFFALRLCSPSFKWHEPRDE